VHIIENHNTRAEKVYCYAGECLWDKQLKKYVNPRVLVGHMEGEPPVFVPNKKYSLLLADTSQTVTDERDQDIIDVIKAKYGNRVRLTDTKPAKLQAQTAIAVFSGPSVVFGGITSRYHIDTILTRAFGEDDAKEILSLAWYLASEGDALINSDAWLSYFENPAGHEISSQDITRLLDRMGQDGILSFYKHWLKRFEKTGDKMLYDLTSISWHGHGIDMASWGHNRDNDDLPQVNYALLCTRSTAMPLFAWPIKSLFKNNLDKLQFFITNFYAIIPLTMETGFLDINIPQFII